MLRQHLGSIVLLLSCFFICSSFVLCVRTTTASEFRDKVVYVSGGTSGIGFQTTLKFAREGARVVFVARDEHPDWYNGTTVQKIINSDPIVTKDGGSALFYKCDIRDRSSLRSVFKFIDSKFGKLDIAVNNAAIGGPGYNLYELPEEYIMGPHDPLLNNGYGTLNQLYEELRYWASKKDNSTEKVIVNLSSYNGLRACPGCALYSASKHAIIGLTKSVALEHIKPTAAMPRIRVNALLPGLIDTPLTRNQVKSVYGEQPWQGPLITDTDPLWLKMKPEFEKMLIGGRLGKPEEMADVIMYLSSDRASYISGASFSADNGDTAK
ncbi:hypothetical protein ABK040_008456 [Willaertia magna]